VTTLTAAKSVSAEASGFRVPDRTREKFLPSPADSRPYVDAWVAALEPLREHVDMAVFLSLPAHGSDKGGSHKGAAFPEEIQDVPLLALPLLALDRAV
jgi:hypothetical protein